MATEKRRSALSYIPGFYTNAVLQVILASGVAFVMLGICWAIIQIMYTGGDPHFNDYFVANIGLPSLANFKEHWWTPLIYGWFHFNGFMELLSNMLWLYCFGSVVQMLVGHKQIIPLYAYSLTVGGIVYLLAQMLPGSAGRIPQVAGLLGSRAGLMAMAAAAVTLAPRYRFYLTEHFSVPLLLVAGVFAGLMFIGSFSYIPVLALVVAGGLSGFGYVKLLKAGYRPGEWMYTLSHRVASLVTPNEDAIRAKRNQGRNENKYGRVSQSRVDSILDKINQKGVSSLTAEEREILAKASKE